MTSEREQNVLKFRTQRVKPRNAITGGANVALTTVIAWRSGPGRQLERNAHRADVASHARPDDVYFRSGETAAINFPRV